MIAAKAKLAQDNGISVIACIGEKLDERETGKTMEVVAKQMKAINGMSHTSHHRLNKLVAEYRSGVRASVGHWDREGGVTRVGTGGACFHP